MTRAVFNLAAYIDNNSILLEKDYNNHRVCEIIKILGIYFGYDEKQRNDLNFRQTLKSIIIENRPLENTRFAGRKWLFAGR